eukprot:g1131.t1
MKYPMTYNSLNYDLSALQRLCYDGTFNSELKEQIQRYNSERNRALLGRGFLSLAETHALMLSSKDLMEMMKRLLSPEFNRVIDLTKFLYCVETSGQIEAEFDGRFVIGKREPVLVSVSTPCLGLHQNGTAVKEDSPEHMAVRLQDGKTYKIFETRRWSSGKFVVEARIYKKLVSKLEVWQMLNNEYDRSKKGIGNPEARRQLEELFGQIRCQERMTPKFKDEYILGRFISSGADGPVYKCRSKREPGLELAVKFEEVKYHNYRRGMDQLEIFQKTKGMEGVVQLYEYLQSPTNRLCSNQVMHFIEGREVLEFVPPGGFSGFECATIMDKALKIAQRLHARGIYHRDVKVENLMYDPKTTNLTFLDWGHSLLEEPESSDPEDPFDCPPITRLNSTSGLGTPGRRPEKHKIVTMTPVELVSYQFAAMFHNLLTCKQLGVRQNQASRRDFQSDEEHDFYRCLLECRGKSLNCALQHSFLSNHLRKKRKREGGEVQGTPNHQRLRLTSNDGLLNWLTF